MTTWICNACGGPVYVLGALGRLLWGRCRSCGCDSCRKTRRPRRRNAKVQTAPAREGN